MSNYFKLFFLLFPLLSCSFDDKTGIWTDNQEFGKKENNKDILKKDLKNIFEKNEIFNKIIQPSREIAFKLQPIKTSEWLQENQNSLNNISNLKYSNKKNIILKSSKISGNKLSQNIFYEKKHIISSDNKGNVFVYSENENKIIFKYNFYKKKYKRYNKLLSLALDENTIFVADNLGYIYALNYLNKKIIWAKNYGIPFFSNIKIFQDNVILSNKDNKLFMINKLTGEKKWEFATEDTSFKTNFKNSIAHNSDQLLFLNSNNSIYSFNIKAKKLRWFQNLNQYASEDVNLFYGMPLLIDKNYAVFSDRNKIIVLDVFSGNLIWKKNISVKTKPIITGDFIFTLTTNNFLICINKKSGEIFWSSKLSQIIENYSDKIKFNINSINYISIINNQILMFSNTGYMIEASMKDSKILGITKIKNNINSKPIFINENIYFLNSKNKIIKIN